MASRETEMEIFYWYVPTNIDACIHVYTIHVRYRYFPFIVLHSIRFEDHKDEGRSREVGISGPPHAAMVQASEWRSG